MENVTEMLNRLNAGDERVVEQLMQTVYGELRLLAARQFSGERLDHSLQPTALVNEAYLRLIASDKSPRFESRAHFFVAAAQAMQRILIDSARARKCLKRGGEYKRVGLEDLVDVHQPATDLLLDLDDGLRRLAEEDALSAKLVQLRVFAGLSVTEAGKVLGLSRTVAYENWEFARSWFAVFL